MDGHINANDYKPYIKRFILKEPPYFNWLPSHIFTGCDISILQQLEKPQDFFRYITEFEPIFKLNQKNNKPLHISTLKKDNYFHKRIYEFIRLAIIALRLRSAFRRLVHYWIWKKAAAHLPCNEDIITLCPFRQPIDILDMKHRRIYRFEAKALLKHLDSQLQYLNNGYPAPHIPKNPYTNTIFSSAQLYVIYDKLLSYKLMSSTFAGFYECCFNIIRYEKMYRESIDNINKFTSMKDYNNEDGQQELVEFIDSIANQLKHPHSDEEIDLYYYAVYDMPTHPIFLKWRKLFLHYHFLDDMDSTEAKPLLKKIYKEGENLLHMRATFFDEIRRLQLKNVDSE